MAKKKQQWSKKFYRDVLLGNRDEIQHGLRSLAYGFDPSDNFNLIHFKDWTPAQKRKVQKMYHAVKALTAQPKAIKRPRKTENLRKMQKVFHGNVQSKNLKVAFVPWSDPYATMPGLKVKQPKVRILKDRAIVETDFYYKQTILFDPKLLVKEPRKEIKRALDQAPNASWFFVLAEENETLNSLYPELLTEQIIKWMHRYDGKTPLPRGSRHYGDAPKMHDYRRWLNGVVAYTLKGGQDARAVRQSIVQGIRENKRRRRALKNYEKRKDQNVSKKRR